MIDGEGVGGDVMFYFAPDATADEFLEGGIRRRAGQERMQSIHNTWAQALMLS